MTCFCLLFVFQNLFSNASMHNRALFSYCSNSTVLGGIIVNHCLGFRKPITVNYASLVPSSPHPQMGIPLTFRCCSVTNCTVMSQWPREMMHDGVLHLSGFISVEVKLVLNLRHRIMSWTWIPSFIGICQWSEQILHHHAFSLTPLPPHQLLFVLQTEFELASEYKALEHWSWYFPLDFHK